LQAAALEADLVLGRVIDDPRRGHRPARPPRATGFAGHWAGRVDRILERRDIAVAPAARGRDPSAALQHHQQIVDAAVAKRLGQHHPLADQFVAFGVEHDDIALGPHLAGPAVPNDPVGGDIISVARHTHRARRGDHIIFGVVAHLVGSEAHQVLLGGSAGSGAAGCALAVAGASNSRGNAVHQANRTRKKPVPAAHVLGIAYRTCPARRQSAPLPLCLSAPAS
jgi:hypothetical protein